MSDKVGKGRRRSEVELLLPWYVTGKLDAADKARVEAFLATHPKCSASSRWCARSRSSRRRSNEALGAAVAGVDSRA